MGWWHPYKLSDGRKIPGLCIQECGDGCFSLLENRSQGLIIQLIDKQGIVLVCLFVALHLGSEDEVHLLLHVQGQSSLP